ncbi:MAG: ribosome maturation factor RimM [Gemmatimonadaceae bacterium]|nr:ribosome maturation factor RimM [Gemmatimonadaceae bacterium]
MDAFAIVGRVRRAHGVKGELFLDVLTDAPEAILAPGASRVVADLHGTPLRTPDGAVREVVVRAVRDFKDGVLITFEGVDDRTAAEQWRDRTLLAPVAELAAPEGDELWLHEIPGMQVRDPQGNPVGEVESYYELPHALVLEIRTPTGRRDLPFNEAFVHDVDRVARTLTVTLLDEEEA